MPETKVVLFAETDGSAPLLTWLDGLPERVQIKCIARIERLKAMGYELRRPETDLLRDGIHELRVRHGRVNYRMLYFFTGGQAVISHGLTKEDVVPDIQIERALRRKVQFESNCHESTGALIVDYFRVEACIGLTAAEAVQGHCASARVTSCDDRPRLVVDGNVAVCYLDDASGPRCGMGVGRAADPRYLANAVEACGNRWRAGTAEEAGPCGLDPHERHHKERLVVAA